MSDRVFAYFSISADDFKILSLLNGTIDNKPKTPPSFGPDSFYRSKTAKEREPPYESPPI